MKAIFALAVLLPLAAATAPLLNAEEKTAIPDEYIVVFHANATFTGRSKHMGMVRAAMMDTKIEAGEPKILFEYNFPGFQGYAFRAGEDVLAKVMECGEVKYVERNLEVHATQATCTRQTGATWGIVRINQVERNLNGEYDYLPALGEGVDAYILDTGIYTQHNDFGGRAIWGIDTVDNPSPETDENGHGTHVTGTVIGNLYGVAKGGTAIAVKVLNRNGSGTWAQVIAGVEYTVTSMGQRRRPSVANMSLGGGRQQSLNDAVAAANDAGVLFVVAAGNEYTDACTRSPASEPKAFTVGATDNLDRKSSFSNYGTCVNIFAPGSSITSAWIGGQFADNTISGTSMASPHTCGVAAAILSQEPSLTIDQLKAKITQTATQDKIIDVGTGSPNLLAFHDCGGDAGPERV